jgi:hypothetical protein
MPARTLPTVATAAWRGRLAAGAAAMALAASLTLGGPIAAQDGTGGAPPLKESGCVLVPASDLDALLAGDDVATIPATPAATPVASPAASPVPGASPVAAPLTFDAALLTDDLTATTAALASCLTEGRFDDAAARTSPLFRGQLVGSQRPLQAATFASLASTFPDTDYHIVESVDATLLVESTASAEIVWQLGHQVRVDRWIFTREPVQGIATWVVDRAEPGTATPSREAVEIDVTIAKNRYSITPETVSGDAVAFRVTNQDAEAHELLVLKLDKGVSTDALLTTPGPELPKGVTFVGQATIPPGGAGGLLLADLDPGTYTIVDMLPDAEGLPHLAGGMEATFEIKQ